MKRGYAAFNDFKSIIEIVVNLDSLSVQDIEEYMNEWYELYNETKYHDVIEWAKFHFETVNQSTHDFWLDKRGLMLYELKGMISVSGIFPIAI